MGNMEELITGEELRDKKRDYSPFLVHLTRDCEEDIEEFGHVSITAKEILKQILEEQTLRAFEYKCLFNDDINSLSISMKDLFRVTCFTETPLDQIDILMRKVYGRDITFSPHGLVFKKEYISQKGGNPVFYAGRGLFDTLWQLYEDAKNRDFSPSAHKFLALVNRCDEKYDFHWEREWRIVGNLEFELEELYCGLCPRDEIDEFENRFRPVKFIDPYWGINKILAKLIGK
jgi:hypothetical protein